MMTAIKDIKPGLKNINVVFIVLEIGSATVTKENREVRNYKVADHSACINVSIWDEPGKGILPGDIIKMTKGYASIWRHCLTLYSGKSGEVFKVGEFCMTFNEQLNMSEPKRAEPQPAALPGTTSNTSTLQATTTTASAGNNGNNASAAATSLPRVAMQSVSTAATKQPSIAATTANLSTTASSNTASTAQNMEPAAVTTTASKARGTRASSIKIERR